MRGWSVKKQKRAWVDGHLVRFWQQIGKKKRPKYLNRWIEQNKIAFEGTKWTRLRLLKDFAKLKHNSNHNTSAKRNKFNEIKHDDVPMVGRCFACRKWYAKVRHHIIGLNHGGHNGKHNIVRLCVWCHAQIHPWLQDRLHKPEPIHASADNAPWGGYFEKRA